MSSHRQVTSSMQSNYNMSAGAGGGGGARCSNRNVQQQSISSSNSATTAQPKSLPCKKMICTGICTYRNRCHYIHDARIMTSASKAKGACRKKNKEEQFEQKDLFFWPPMATQPNREARNYSVSSIGSEPLSGSEAVASLWHHFVEMCVKIGNHTDLDIAPDQSDSHVNPVSRRPRLSVFVQLASGTDLFQSPPQSQPLQQILPQEHAVRRCSPPLLPAPASPPSCYAPDMSHMKETSYYGHNLHVGCKVSGASFSQPHLHRQQQMQQESLGQSYLSARTLLERRQFNARAQSSLPLTKASLFMTPIRADVRSSNSPPRFNHSGYSGKHREHLSPTSITASSSSTTSCRFY